MWETEVLSGISHATYGAADTLAADVHGWSKGGWARLSGRNPSTVTRTTDN